MVKISGIEYMRNCACILLDTGERFWLQKNDLKKSSITEGKTCEREWFLREIRNFQYPQAMNIAVSMLARRPCSKSEISSRLIYRRFTEEVIDLVLYKLEKEELIDDTVFSEQWIRFRSGQGFGPSLIRYELKQKGVPEDTIQELLGRMDPDTVQDNAVNIARKAWCGMKSVDDIRKKRQKVINLLVRKGFGWNEARYACEITECEKK